MVEVDGLEPGLGVNQSQSPGISCENYWLNQTSCFEAAVWESADNV